MATTNRSDPSDPCGSIERGANISPPIRCGDVTTEPAEHVRFRAYVRALSQVSDAEEFALLAEVLEDPDRTVADAAVLGHLDRRAVALADPEEFTTWSRQIAGILRGRELPGRRLREWSVLKDIDSGQSWSTAELIEASDWLQRRLAEHSGSHLALTVLADQGRTRRTRNTARARLGQRTA